MWKGQCRHQILVLQTMQTLMMMAATVYQARIICQALCEVLYIDHLM